MMVKRRRNLANQIIQKHQGDERFQHELKEMQETQDLDRIDDDVEDVATLFEWYAPEHNHLPKSPKWFAALAAFIAIVTVAFVLLANFTAAMTTAFIGSLMYYVAQRKPEQARYRLMVDGVAIGNRLYHYRDIEGFNVIYEPGETKTVLMRSKHKLSPLLHMEIGDADPVAIRDILLEFVRENQDIEEPMVDVWARRLGF